MKTLFATWKESFLHLLFPPICGGCNKVRLAGDKALCISCVSLLPDPTRRLLSFQPLSHIALEAIYHLYHLRSLHPLGINIIYAIKYRQQPDIATFLGQYYAQGFQKVYKTLPWDLIIPIPLHPRRQQKRGYNQSYYVASGLAASWGLPIAAKTLIRHIDTTSQTYRSKEARFTNVAQAFAILDHTPLVGKHVLLVDDVVTTGATLVHAAKTLLDSGAQQVSAFALASGISPNI